MRLTHIALIFALMAGAASAQDEAAAGPDFWAVTGLSAGGSLNIRSGPSAAAAVAVQVSEGTVLRNLGCEGEGSGRWCKVESPDGLAVSGWASGLYLSESAPPSDGDAIVDGTPYNATGRLPCKLVDHPETTDCPFGVIRATTGLASIFITLPGEDQRLIEFRDGQPVAPTGTTMTSSKIGDMTTVVLDGGWEIYTIADVVFLGD